MCVDINYEFIKRVKWKESGGVAKAAGSLPVDALRADLEAKMG